MNLTSDPTVTLTFCVGIKILRATHLFIMLYLSVNFIKFASVVSELWLRHEFDLRPDCGLDLGRRNPNLVRDTSFHIMLYLSVNFHQICFRSFSVLAETRFVTDGRTNGRTDRRTDGAILICLLKSLRGHKMTADMATFLLYRLQLTAHRWIW